MADVLQPGPSNAAQAPEQNRRRRAESVDDAAAAAGRLETDENVAADQEGEQSSDVSDESDIDSSDNTDDVDSDDEDKQNETQREPQVDPASLESETFEKYASDAIEPVWKDFLKKEKGDKLVRDHVTKVVSYPEPTDGEPVPRGIQSLYSSTSTDCALYAMFATNDTFDYLFLEKKARCKDPVSVVRILKDYVVTPLRNIGFVGAKRTIALKLAMQRAADLDMKSVIGERKVSDFLKDLMESMGVEPQFYTVRTEERSPKMQKSPAYALEVTVKNQLTEGDDEPLRYTSQQLIEQYTLDEHCKITNPLNLVLHLKRTVFKGERAVPVYPLKVINLLDSMTGVYRRCVVCELIHNKTTEATLQCHTCFRCDEKHMQLKSCLYCDDCYKTVHEGFGGHVSSPIYGPSCEEHKDLIRLFKKGKNAGSAENASEDIPLQITDEHNEVTYPYELYAIICESLSAGHVAYVSADVELPRSEIEKYSHACRTENSNTNTTQESSTEPAAAAAAAPAQGADASTKPKDPADAAKVQRESSEPTGTTLSTTSDTAMSSSEEPRPTAPRKLPDEEVPVWLLFNPEEHTRHDARGGYNLPQVHTVTNLDDLISADKSGTLDMLDDDPVKQARFRILCESVALFYRPMVKDTVQTKRKPQDQSPESVPVPDAEAEPNDA